jgi:hypothetical protein
MGTPATHSCPRCGYDQSGVVASWDTADPPRCPLRTICSECGHTLDWSVVSHPARQDLPWCVEHAPSHPELLRRALPTLVRVLLIVPYWRAVGVDTRVRLRPLVTWTLLVLLATLLFSALAIAAGPLYDWLFFGTPLANSGELLGAAPLAPQFWLYQAPNAAGGRSFAIDTNHNALTFLVLPIVVTCSWPLLLACLPFTRRLAKLRGAHIGRAWIASLALIAVVHASARGVALPLAAWGVLWDYEIAYVLAVGPGLWALISAWWSVAIIIGWRLKHARATAILLGIAALLLGLVIGVSALGSLLMA